MSLAFRCSVMDNDREDVTKMMEQPRVDGWMDGGWRLPSKDTHFVFTERERADVRMPWKMPRTRTRHSSERLYDCKWTHE